MWQIQCATHGIRHFSLRVEKNIEKIFEILMLEISAELQCENHVSCDNICNI